MRRLVFAVLVLIGLGTAPAAADDEVQLSSDGRYWSADLTGPLFDPGFLWVPGDHKSRALWVRNAGPTSGLLTVRVLDPTADGLMQTGDLAITVRGPGGTGSAVTLPTGGVLLADAELAAGAVERLNVSVAFDPTSTSITQHRRLDLRLQVTLRQVVPPDDLPGTGSPVDRWSLPVAGGAVLVGAFLVFVGRRRDGDA